MFPIVGDEWREYDGCYLCFDPNRSLIFRAGMTVIGLGPRWDQHERASRLTSQDTKWRNFYRKYPHVSVKDQCPDRDGTFEQLDQRVGLAVRKSDTRAVTELFPFTEIDNYRLKQLSYGPNRAGTQTDKQYKHICYMFELLFNIAIEQRKNTTQNPGCEWQLQWNREDGN